MDYPVIDPVETGSNIRTLIRNSGNTITGVGRLLGLADMSTMYKWLRGDALPGIDNMLALVYKRIRCGLYWYGDFSFLCRIYVKATFKHL